MCDLCPLCGDAILAGPNIAAILPQMRENRQWGRVMAVGLPLFFDVNQARWAGWLTGIRPNFLVSGPGNLLDAVEREL